MPARQSKIERRLVAILSADIKDYSLMMGSNEELTHRRIGAEIGRLTQLLEKFGGSVFSTAGDGLMAEFSNMSAALKVALHIQAESAKRNSKLPSDQKILFRIGINSGDIIVQDTRRGGDSINVAARLEQLAEPGGICISRAVYEQVHRTMPLNFEFVAEARLKNIAGTVAVYMVTKQGQSMSSITERLRGGHLPLLPAGPSIAALPFDNLSHPGEAYLCDGLVEDIITGLSKFRNLFVVGRYSSFTFRDQRVDTKRVARELGVRYLLQGSVRKSDRKLRVTAQLLDGFSGQVLWADQFDGDLSDVFSMQSDVLQTIVARLAVRLEGIERDRLRNVEKSDIEAYQHLLRGQEFVWRFDQSSNANARALFGAARLRDPDYARAYSALSRTYNWEWRYSWTEHREQALDRALELAQQSLSLDNIDPRGHSELGFAYLYKKQRDLAIQSYQRALELNPNDADVMAELADAYAYDDQVDMSLNLLDRAMRLNPLFPDWYLWYLADALFALERYTDVITTIQRMKDPGQGHRLAAASFAHLGRMDEARVHAHEVMKRHPNFSITKWAEVPPEKVPERLDRLVGGLKMAGLPD
jgi:adenylate cyclase